MDMNASAGSGGTKGKKSFFEWCEKLTLKATRSGESQLFAAIASVFVHGGTIKITRLGEVPVEVTFGDGPAEPEAPAVIASLPA